MVVMTLDVKLKFSYLRHHRINVLNHGSWFVINTGRIPAQIFCHVHIIKMNQSFS